MSRYAQQVVGVVEAVAVIWLWAPLSVGCCQGLHLPETSIVGRGLAGQHLHTIVAVACNTAFHMPVAFSIRHMLTAVAVSVNHS